MSDLISQLHAVSEPALPGSGETASRHHGLAEIARRNLSLARLAEAHFDALAILAEAGRAPVFGALYGVWASEIPGQTMTFRNGKLSGRKRFCTGAGLLDRALVTATDPEHRLIDIDLRATAHTFRIDRTEWITPAFADTSTATVNFDSSSFEKDDLIGPSGWYLDRPGFWPGALGPAACWAGGALGLVDWALAQKRSDPHTLAHLGGLEADAWQLRSILTQAGHEIDAHPRDIAANHKLALATRHLIEQSCADILTRIARAYGPHPLAFDSTISLRYSEVELYIRQCHAERDLAALGELSRAPVMNRG
jgi:alkylation response protein AidB-like acyl-CoA dehydrogenase